MDFAVMLSDDLGLRSIVSDMSPISPPQRPSPSPQILRCARYKHLSSSWAHKCLSHKISCPATSSNHQSQCLLKGGCRDRQKWKWMQTAKAKSSHWKSHPPLLRRSLTSSVEARRTKLSAVKRLGVLGCRPFASTCFDTDIEGSTAKRV